MDRWTKLGCGLQILIITLYIVLSAWSVNMILSWFDKDIPVWADCLIGLFSAGVSIPVGVIGYILQVFGVF